MLGKHRDVTRFRYSFLAAARADNRRVLEALLGAFDEGATELARYRALSMAVTLGHVECIDILIRYTTSEQKLNNMLTEAANAGCLRSVDHLLRMPTVDMTANDHRALYAAARANKVLILDRFLALPGVAADQHLRSRALNAAAREGASDCVARLLASGPLSYAYTKSTMVAAAKRGYTDIVTMILPNLVNAQSTLVFAIAEAAIAGHAHIVDLLLRVDDAPSGNDAPPRLQRTIRRCAANGYIDVVKMLLAALPKLRTTEALKYAATDELRAVLAAPTRKRERNDASDD